MSSETPDRRVQDIVAVADQHRRARDARRLVIRLAPLAGAAAVAVAVAVRMLGASSMISIGVLAALGVVIVAVAVLLGRRRPSTDAIALQVDTDARLHGELRSAHWFSVNEVRDDWTNYHLARAADRAGEVSWRELYPQESGTRAWLMSGVCAVVVVALAVVVPQRQSLVAAGTEATAATPVNQLPPDLQAKLEQMLARMKDGTLQPDAATLKDLQDIAKLDPKLQKTIDELMKNKLGQDAQKMKDGKPLDPADKERPSNAGLPEDVRYALEDLAKRLANSNQDRQTKDKNPAASDQTGEKGMGSDQAATQQATAAEAQMQLVREASSDASASQMMMGGGGMGGQQSGQQGNNGAQKAAEANVLAIAQALKKETVEANEDMLGKNVQKEDIRRKTEMSRSGMGFTRVAPAATFDKSHATAPPPVPESRRPLLQNYFIRKQ